MKTGFTLLELMVVMIIIGVLATLGITHYAGIRERALDREAQVNLKLIQAAQRIWRMENGGNAYYASGSGQPDAITNINTNLRLLLPITENRIWDYITDEEGCSQATRNVLNGRNWFLLIDDGITSGDGEPDTGTCP